jgi:hypothetical protein
VHLGWSTLASGSATIGRRAVARPAVTLPALGPEVRAIGYGLAAAGVRMTARQAIRIMATSASPMTAPMPAARA